ncbi:hypothetical protein F5Y06DRAFT_63003 [Hypoxylon sp. FL0890]|nr:hypothetical protein F5Y06DRAFT_63003 [Hypoxylon sp. FL0890]
MDIQDVSDFGQFKVMLQNIEVNMALASLRKGETPRNLPSPSFLIQQHMLQLQSQLQSNAHLLSQERHTIATSQVPAPYPPCTLRATELKPIPISQMKLETHHRGCKVVVRVMVPPSRITAIMAIVEDERGTATLLQLYNQPPEALVPAGESLRQGCFYLLKEPFFKGTASGSYSLRVDHVSDIMLLSDSDELVPTKWRKTKTIAETSGSIRKRGNEAVGKKNWAEA